ncbi:sugar ABC transporter substrate-binding protein [Helcococcus kunzii]|uniref:sugar ABC transporter substrate-binding protein n=1 Tax=Helcococcus kunzii TaxID=40091 RepID=UPI0024AD6066|nr:extracellular solute-binding protein [Helcococcus kunzii]
MKTNYKKLLSLLLALVMVFSLVACGNKGGESKDEANTESTGESKDGEKTDADATPLKGEISVQAEKGWVPYYEAAIKKITEKNPDAKINIKEAGAFDHIEVINNTDATNADVADVFALPADKFTDMADNDILAALPAKEMADKIGGWDDFDAGLGGNLKKGEDYLAFPMNIETLLTFVNTKNAEKAGIDHTKPFELNDQKDPATVLLKAIDAWFGVAPNNAGGIDLLTKDGDQFKSTYTGKYEDLNADQKAVFDGLFAYWKANNEAGTSLFDEKSADGYMDGEFATGGKGVIRLEGPWATSNDSIIAKEIKAGNVEVYPIGHITIAGKPLTHWQGGWTLAVNSRIEEDADKMALAEALIMELINPENAVEFYKATGKILENVKVDVYEKSDLDELSKKVIKNVIEGYNASPARPLYKEYGKVWDTWKNAVLSWNSVKPADAAAAYKELNAAFTGMMEQIKAGN